MEQSAYSLLLQSNIRGVQANTAKPVNTGVSTDRMAIHDGYCYKG